jgi:hypothetical protein
MDILPRLSLSAPKYHHHGFLAKSESTNDQSGIGGVLELLTSAETDGTRVGFTFC